MVEQCSFLIDVQYFIRSVQGKDNYIFQIIIYMICMFRVKELKKDTHGSFNIRPQTVLTTSTGTDRIMSSNGTSERLPKMDVEPQVCQCH